MTLVEPDAAPGKSDAVAQPSGAVMQLLVSVDHSSALQQSESAVQSPAVVTNPTSATEGAKDSDAMGPTVNLR